MKIIIRTESDQKRVVDYVNSLNVQKVWDVEINPYKSNRSLSQNRLYWKWITIIGDELGYTKEEMHNILANKFLASHEVEAFGEKIHVIPSTSSLNTGDFARYLTNIEIFAGTELGIVLPNRDDEFYEAMGYSR